MFTLYNKDQRKKFDFAPTATSTQVQELQGEDTLNLSFSDFECRHIEVGDYVDFMGTRYFATERYVPTMRSTMEWQYNFHLQGPASYMRRFLVLSSQEEPLTPDFALTDTAYYHLQNIVYTLNQGLHTSDWKIGATPNDERLLTIDYRGTYVSDALRLLVEKINEGGKQSVEWWIEGTTINLSRCERGERLPLAYREGLVNLSRTAGRSRRFFTRLFPIGSSRNIDPEEYGASRLHLPKGQPYISVHEDEFGIYDRYEKSAFADIYPSRIGTLTSVRQEERRSKDGKTLVVYFFTDEGMDFDPNTYAIAGLTKKISFQSGDLEGFGEGKEHAFEVNFHSDTHEFEIIAQYDEQRQRAFPNTSIAPHKGDTYVLWNIRMPEPYYRAAETELKERAEAFIAAFWADAAVYKATTDHVFLEGKAEELYLGRSVRLKDKTMFPNGYTDTRIIRLSRKLGYPACVDIEMSNAAQEGRLAQIDDSIVRLKDYTRRKTAQTNLPDIIRTFDNTPPTDNNIFSAQRSEREFLSAKEGDAAKGLINFEKGINIGGEACINAARNGMFNTLDTHSIGSPDFADGLTGHGFVLEEFEGQSRLVLDTLTVRGAMSVMELLINKVRSVGGQVVISATNGKVSRVRENTNTYTLYFDTPHGFQVGDFVRSATFDGTAPRSYWVAVERVGSKHIEIKKAEFNGQSTPQTGDELVLWGSRDKKKRSSAISLSATDDGTPRIDVLWGIRKGVSSPYVKARLGGLDGIHSAAFPESNQPRGYGLFADNAYLKGNFTLINGKDVRSEINFTRGLISTSITGIINQLNAKGNYIANPSFLQRLTYWRGGGLTVADNIKTFGAQKYVQFKGTYIEQEARYMHDLPLFPKSQDHKAQRTALPFFVIVECEFLSGGKLSIEFLDVDHSGFEPFNALHHIYMYSPNPSASQRRIVAPCLWNGTGKLRISFTGEIVITSVQLTSDRAEALKYEYRTLFEQSPNLLKLTAAVFDKDKNAIKETGLFLKPEGAGIYAQDAKGNVSTIGVEEGGRIKLQAKNIQMEGLITANQNFKVLTDGSIQAKNGTFTGEIHTYKGVIGGFQISHGCIGVDPKTTPRDDGGAWANLSLTQDLIKVGGANAYVMWGDDVAPDVGGGVYTSAGYISNHAKTDTSPWDLGTTNYGMRISVTGGTRNVGLYSDAPLHAPSFINTKAAFLTLKEAERERGYKIDLSQANIFLLKSDFNALLTLPDERAVAEQFGLGDNLPEDFALNFILKVRSYSSTIRISGLYNAKDKRDFFDLNDGNVLHLLLTKSDDFTYNLVGLER